jgi:hypothetical protein
MSRRQAAEDKRRAAEERRKQEQRAKKLANLEKARSVKAELLRTAAAIPQEIKPPKIRVSPTGYTNRAGAAAILMRHPHTLENWAARGIGPEYELVNGRVQYKVQKVIDWKGEAAE